MNRILFLILIIATPTFAQPTTQPVIFSHPDRIRYDGHCVTIEGKDIVIFSGAFHYARCPKPLWADRFAKIKAAGCNAVETYVPWNWHEQNAPASLEDQSQIDLTDLRDWLKMAHEQFGLYTIIRPGPYICAEWRRGGFPSWLMLQENDSATTKPTRTSSWLRSDDPVFLAWETHWYNAVCPVIAAEQITRKKPGEHGVILFQIENEYDYAPGISQKSRVGQLKSLYSAAVANGIDVPIFTCWTKQTRSSDDPQLKNVFDAVNSYPRYSIEATGNILDQAHSDEPFAPPMVSELQGGWFASVGGRLSEDQSGVTAAQENAITLMSLAHGATILNYYMLFGGTNFGDWGGRGMTTTYDYAAPIRESGAVGEKYQRVQRIGEMLQAIGPQLSRADAIEVINPTKSAVHFYVRRAQDGTRFVFAWNSDRKNPITEKQNLQLADGETIRVDINLEPFGFKLLALSAGETDSSRGTWWPRYITPISRPPSPAAINLTQAMVIDDPSPQQWQPLHSGDNYVNLGIEDSRYVTYRANAQLSDVDASQFQALRLAQQQSDPLLVTLNGKVLPDADRFNGRTQIPVNNALRAGDNAVQILYENLGYSNGGLAMHDLAGITAGGFAHVAFPDLQLTDWRVKVFHGKPTTLPTEENADDADWQNFTLDADTIAELDQTDIPGVDVKHQAARLLFSQTDAFGVFRDRFDLTADAIASGRTQLALDRVIDQADVFINGQLAGHVGKSHALKTNIAKWIHPGSNLIAIAVTGRRGESGLLHPPRITGAKVEQSDLNWSIATQLGGLERGYENADIDTHDWRNVDLAAVPDADANATWTRVNFSPLNNPIGQWFPWRATIRASGNGLVYLNGHFLGRYWNAGPQHDFFLPECWLDAKKNNLTLFLRRVDGPPKIESIDVSTYPESGEFRPEK